MFSKKNSEPVQGGDFIGFNQKHARTNAGNCKSFRPKTIHSPFEIQLPFVGCSTRVAYRRGPTLCRFWFLKSCRHVLPIFLQSDFFIDLPVLEKPFTPAEC